MLTDIEIAQSTTMRLVKDVAYDLGIMEEELESYGRYKAKLSLQLYDRVKNRPDGKLIYVTAITPTPAGEGKTCTAVGVTQGLGKLGKNVVLCLREPSLGPTFGVKGGAAGGGYSQVLPMEDINLHFTGDIHAVGSAHNLLSAIMENHIHHGNELGIDPTRVLWKRVMDISDRQLRNIVVGLGGKSNGIPLQSSFDITVASEIMAILCLTTGMEDLKQRLSKILVAYTYENRPVFARELHAVGSMAVLLKDAIKPNLVQTIEGQPALLHGGPFANIAHGNNSVLATRLGLKLGDYVVTEGGFAADLGAEKFFDIVAAQNEIRPDICILVASIRALKYHGGVSKENVNIENLIALQDGFSNLDQHIDNLKNQFGLPLVVAINRFPNDTEAELEMVRQHCLTQGTRVALSEVVAQGGDGGIELANKVLEALANDENHFTPIYNKDMPLEEKINCIATKIYRADGVLYTKEARSALKKLTDLGYGILPVCIAKTQTSFSDDPTLKGAPRGWKLTVREVRLSAGAGFVVVLTGNMVTMPGLPKHPAAEKIDIQEDGTILGLF